MEDWERIRRFQWWISHGDSIEMLSSPNDHSTESPIYVEVLTVTSKSVSRTLKMTGESYAAGALRDHSPRASTRITGSTRRGTSEVKTEGSE